MQQTVCAGRAAVNLAYTQGAMAPSVLVVDDDPNLVRLMSKFLTLEGFAPIPAANGAEALKYLRAGGIVSVILLDLRMPVMDGWTFRREQRGDPDLAEIPIVVLSGMEMDGVQDMDAAASFHKPVSFPEVVDVLRRICEIGH
jgi:CheY-like chemotaxis protein